jgi:uncharacterized protein (TIGR02452 family)
MSLSKSNRAMLAQNTLSIMQDGHYTSPVGKSVSIAATLAKARAGTTLYQPDDCETLLQRAEAVPALASATLTVSRRTTLEAGRELAQTSDAVACLNFASAKNPGGGFLGGAQAQEESLARSSGLYATLQTQLSFYQHHRAGESCLYSHHAIYSPNVPVFRDDEGRLLDEPWECAFITSAAVNAGAIHQNEPARVREIVPVMEERTRMVLAIAIAHGCQTLVLGAWGCGVFRNDPTTIAAVFSRVLSEAAFQNKIQHIEFAVYDPTSNGAIFGAFEHCFNGRS